MRERIRTCLCNFLFDHEKVSFCCLIGYFQLNAQFSSCRVSKSAPFYLTGNNFASPYFFKALQAICKEVFGCFLHQYLFVIIVQDLLTVSAIVFCIFKVNYIHSSYAYDLDILFHICLKFLPPPHCRRNKVCSSLTV